MKDQSYSLTSSRSSAAPAIDNKINKTMNYDSVRNIKRKNNSLMLGPVGKSAETAYFNNTVSSDQEKLQYSTCMQHQANVNRSHLMTQQTKRNFLNLNRRFVDSFYGKQKLDNPSTNDSRVTMPLPKANVKYRMRNTAYNSFEMASKKSVDEESDNSSVTKLSCRKAFPQTELPSANYKKSQSALRSTRYSDRNFDENMPKGHRVGSQMSEYSK